MVKVARMYHERGRKQAQIAGELHITQARVSRLLRRASDTGIVKTVVSSPAGVHTDLEERLEERYGLTEAVVVDALSSEEHNIAQNLAAAAAVYLESTLLGDEIVGISSWSATLLAAVTFAGAGHQSGGLRSGPTRRRGGGTARADRRQPPSDDVRFRDRRHPNLLAGAGAAGQRRRPTQPDV